MEEKKAEDKITAIYVMVRTDELRPEDQGSYQPLIEQQKSACMALLEQQVPADDRGPVEVYTRRGQLLMDLERERIRRLVVEDLNRLGSSAEEVAGLRFELNAAGIPVLSLKS